MRAGACRVTNTVKGGSMLKWEGWGLPGTLWMTLGHQHRPMNRRSTNSNDLCPHTHFLYCVLCDSDLASSEGRHSLQSGAGSLMAESQQLPPEVSLTWQLPQP